MIDGLVEIVKECSRRKDGRKGTSAQAERSGPHSGQLENGVDVEQNPSPDLTERLVGSESLSPSLDYILVTPLKRHVPTPPWPSVLWAKSPVPVMLHLAKC